jgi:hypothetical protein
MNKEKLKKVPHIISSVMILLHSYERFETGHGSYVVFLFAGIIFLSVAIFHQPLSKKFPWIDITFYGIESLLSFVIAYEYWSAGKKGLPFGYIIAGLFQIFAIYMFISRAKKAKSEILKQPPIVSLND